MALFLEKKEHTQTYAHTFTSYAHLSSGGSLSPTDLYFKFLLITIVKQEFMKWNKLLSDKEHHHFCEDAVHKMGEKIFTNFTSDRMLMSRICKTLKQLNTKKANSLTKNWDIELNELSNEKMHMAENI